ncbi:uncharacterized protein MKK02DRAFT_30547 [Dioszegia hungarica]|uniref:Uncharacterized protein n=1 Tax=Dioszegia hungarica TaxID=4972 RepID=A0AA38LQ30_9TREE|nr:uncharacterized protein MKK02DRAFT_30547 [Dioszegia hungarica]KAI9632817.1 hypothetical protein MKK02DRAFT_30547 [Dioszegia hungarica]
MLHPSAALLLTALVASAGLINRQASSAASSAASFTANQVPQSVITTSIFPGGVAQGSVGQESTIPLPCLDGCWPHAAPYAYCFLLDTYPGGRPIPATQCDSLCNQTYYDGLSQCLNCIVANGNERPFGYSTNTSITALPTRAPAPSGSSNLDTTNPNGLIDAAQADGWLRNMTDMCSAKGKALTGATSVTAIPTTTGGYKTSWIRGETIVRPQWTGLTQFPPPVATLTRILAAGSSSTPGASGSGAGSASGSAASGAAASQSSRAAGMATVGQGPAGWALGGALLAWAVLFRWDEGGEWMGVKGWIGWG